MMATLPSSFPPSPTNMAGVYETRDDGASWNEVAMIVYNGACGSIDLRESPPSHGSSVVLLGALSNFGGRPGIERSINGTAGPFVSVLSKSLSVELYRPSANSATVFASAIAFFSCATYACQPSVSSGTVADLGLWASTDDGATWAQRQNTVASVLAHDPRDPAALLYGYLDVYASSDGFTTVHALGLAQQLLSAEAVTGLDYAPPRLLATTNTGRVFSAVWRDHAAPVPVWTEHITPLHACSARSAFVERNTTAAAGSSILLERSQN